MRVKAKPFSAESLEKIERLEGDRRREQSRKFFSLLVMFAKDSLTSKESYVALLAEAEELGLGVGEAGEIIMSVGQGQNGREHGGV